MRSSFASWVVNNMNSTNLKHFKIQGLFDRYNVALHFDKEVNIFIGENGLGKTTILNCLYYVLEKKFMQLEEVEFDSIEIRFRNSRSAHQFTKADLIAFNRKSKGSRAYFNDELVREFLYELNISLHDFISFPAEIRDSYMRQYAHIQGIPVSILRNHVARSASNLDSSKADVGDATKVQKLSGAIDNNIKERIIYLPTYRRIENDFSSLNIRTNETNNAEMLIRFGMADVQISIDTILNNIRALAMQGFNKMTGLLLRQYADGGNNAHTYDPIDADVAKLVLNRLGAEVEEATKREIIRLIESQAIYSYEYIHLLNLLHKLVANYDQQKHYDDCINGFVDTCNKYLRDKQFYYDPSNLTLEVILDAVAENGHTVKLTQLSSGEKQIVSLFSKLYLEGKEKSIVIIDEPELSLSIKWQQMLLPDIMRSGNCRFLLTVTHSPFIFENEFDMDAQEMRAHMQRI